MCRFILFAFILLLFACGKEGDFPPEAPTPVQISINDITSQAIEFDLNPQGITPLAGNLQIQTKEASTIQIRLKDDEELVFRSENSKEHDFNILGLFPGIENNLYIEIENESDGNYALDTLQIQTEPLPYFFPDIEIIESDKSAMEDGWTLIELNIGTPTGFQFYPMMFDHLGRVRYFIDMSSVDGWVGPFRKSPSGNWIWGQWDRIFEFDIFGSKVSEWKLNGAYVHHDYSFKENGNLVSLASVPGISSTQDRMQEIDADTREMIRSWNFREVLDVDRFDLHWQSFDWLHANSVDEWNEQYLISGRHQGIFSVDNSNNLLWIIAPHQGWSLSGEGGDGADTKDYLLTAIDDSGTPYDAEVQQGIKNVDGFSWPWGQHACSYISEDHILCFNNGWNQNFEDDAVYSEAVEYEINLSNKTVRQIWSYGKDRAEGMKSNNISDVDLLNTTSNRLITSGNIINGNIREARVVELQYPNSRVVLDARIIFKNSLSQSTGWSKVDLVYQGERIVFSSQ